VRRPGPPPGPPHPGPPAVQRPRLRVRVGGLPGGGRPVGRPRRPARRPPGPRSARGRRRPRCGAPGVAGRPVSRSPSRRPLPGSGGSIVDALTAPLPVFATLAVAAGLLALGSVMAGVVIIAAITYVLTSVAGVR